MFPGGGKTVLAAGGVLLVLPEAVAFEMVVEGIESISSVVLTPFASVVVMAMLALAALLVVVEKREGGKDVELCKPSSGDDVEAMVCAAGVWCIDVTCLASCG